LEFIWILEFGYWNLMAALKWESQRNPIGGGIIGGHKDRL
jgi:hypothetical protein